MDGVLSVLGSEQQRWALLAQEELRACGYRRESISDLSRILVSDRYNIPVEDQLRIERAFDSDSDIISLDMSEYVPNVVFEHARNFLYVPGHEPDVPTKHVPEIIRKILDSHGKPAFQPSKRCKAVNRHFETQRCPQVLDPIPETSFSEIG